MRRTRKPRSPTLPAPRPALPSPWPWVLLGLATAAVYLTFYLQPGLLWYAGVQHYPIWFADISALLASGDAVRQGLNPYTPNPLDYFGRPHVYSHWWLELRHLGLTRADITWLGPLVVGLFWLATLRALRPGSLRQGCYYFLLLVAPPILLALDRANNDLVIFLVLTPLVPCLRHTSRGVRLLAPVLVALAAGLKYYPAAAGLVLLTPAAPGERRWSVFLGVVLLVATALSVAPDLALFGPLAPHPSGWMSFGAASGLTTLGWTGMAPTLLALAGGGVIFTWAWHSPRLEGWTPATDQSDSWLHFVLGAVLLTGCFFTSANFAYRWVFAVWLAPFLWRLAGDAAAPAPARRLAALTRVLLLAVLWLDTLYTWTIIACRDHATPDTLRLGLKWSFLAEQPLTWAFFGCLLVFLARFTRDGLRGLLGRAPAAA